MEEVDTDSTVSKTGIVPIHSSLYNHHSRNHVEGVSVEICNIMTLLGYGEEIRRRRGEKYMENDMLVGATPSNSTQLTAGSKAEGLTCLAESDRDLLLVLKSVLCVEDGVDVHTIPDDIEVYRMDTRVYPGHCRMLLERPGSSRLNLINTALCDIGDGNGLLSSSFVLDETSKIKHEGVQLERSGPSLPMSTGLGYDIDIVWAVRCQCPGILQRWAQRSRHWPPPDVVLKVVSLGSVVTPIGHKGSEYSYLEWRICFNMGETELVNNLNGTQAKVYVLLKMIVKEVLKPNKKEITSYVLKNIIFWQAERNPPAIFQEKNLIHWLHDALGILRTAISSTQMQYYMIPERNLMAACGLHDEQQRKWVTDIKDMMEEGPRVILRLPRIRQAIIGHPEPLLWFCKRRIELEMLQLGWMNRAVQRRNENGECDDTDDILKIICRRLYETLREVYLRMFMEGSAPNDLDDIMYRMLL